MSDLERIHELERELSDALTLVGAIILKYGEVDPTHADRKIVVVENAPLAELTEVARWERPADGAIVFGARVRRLGVGDGG